MFTKPNNAMQTNNNSKQQCWQPQKQQMYARNPAKILRG
jgi:hypothetical protein